jgi:hypothetical protein
MSTERTVVANSVTVGFTSRCAHGINNPSGHECMLLNTHVECGETVEGCIALWNAYTEGYDSSEECKFKGNCNSIDFGRPCGKIEICELR